MTEWKNAEIGTTSIAFIDGDRGKNYPKSNEFSAEGYCLFLNAGNVTKNGFLFNDNSFISIEKDNTLRKGKLMRGDIVLTTRGTIGNVALYDNKVPFENIRINSGMVIIRHGNDFDTHYLYHFFRSNYFLYQIRQFQSGSAQPQLPISTLNKMRVVCPSLTTQKRIASILSTLDSKIECNRKICANLEAQAQALFKNWFVDFAPFKNGKFVESELGMIPEGWRVGRLGEVININTTYSLKKGVLAPYLDMKNMPTQGSYPIKVEEKEYQGGMKFKNGDALMARITPCLENGKVAYVNFLKDDEIGFGSTEYIVLSTKDASYSELSYFLCRETNFVNYATKNMNGSSGRQRVSGETIGNYKIAIPTRDVVDDLMPIFRNAMREFAVLGAENLRLSALRDSLLPKLMSGEIKI